MTKRPSLAESMKKVETPAAPVAQAVPVSPASQPAARQGYYAATRMGRKKVTAALEPEAHKQLKFLSVEQGHTVEDMLREALSDLFRKYGKPPIA